MKKSISGRSLRKATGKRLGKCGRRWRVLLTALLCTIAVCGVLLMNGAGGSWRRNSGDRFIIIMDAGSTGTRIYVFRYDLRDPNLHLTWIRPEAAKEAVPHRPGIRAYDRVETLPGLQTITTEALGDTHNTTRLLTDVQGRALGPLLKWAKAVIPRHLRRVTPIRLMATAGVRGMSDANQNALLHALHDILSHSEFKVGDEPIKIMSGHEEGVFGWIAVNHEIGTFNASVEVPMPVVDEPPHPSREFPGSSVFGSDTSENSPSPPPLDPENTMVAENMEGAPEDDVWFPDLSKDELVGVLDLGGSSLEVTFPRKSSSSTKMQITGSDYWLESRTFEKLGLNAAFQTSVWILAKEADADNTTSDIIVNHPCLHEGYSKKIKLQSPRSRPDEETTEVTLRGEPSWSQCSDLTEEALDASISCDTAPCLTAANDLLGPMRFVGLNGFHVVWAFFGLGNGALLAQLEHKGEQHCNETWDAVQSSRAGVVQLEMYCFRSVYVSMLLQKIVGYKASSSVHIAPESVSWPIGAAFLEIQSHWQAPDSHGRKIGPAVPISDGPFTSLLWWLAISASALILALVCLRACRRQSGRDPDDYIDIEHGGALKALPRIRQGYEIKRRTRSYKRLHDLAA